ncbi:MAG: DUF2000 domain-containing protein [Chlamydiales bacterium]|nr:DUF2000 domain-containing protein [Chlamydiales bacterium]
MTFEKKLVAVMNKSVESGVLMNALAHMCIGFGANLGSEALQLVDYIDKEDHHYPNISKMPFIILRANSNKIRSLVDIAKEKGIDWSAFTDTMTVGSWEEQLERTRTKIVEELVFYGVVLFGEWDRVTEMTRKFSLWK